MTRVRGWVLYDGSCGLCSRWTASWGPVLARRGLEIAPLQSGWVSERLGLTEAEVLEDMRILLVDGTQLRGADAYREMARRIWWARPLHLVSVTPGLGRIFDGCYRVFARHRHLFSRACGLGDASARSHLARGAAIAGLTLLSSLPLAAQVAEPGVGEGPAGCYVVSGRNDAPDMTIRLTAEAVPDADRFSELPLFEVVALPPENWDGSGEHEVYWSQSSNAEMVMVSWLFYDLESSVNLVFRALATGADGPGILSLFSHTGAGSDRTAVSVARTACPD